MTLLLEPYDFRAACFLCAYDSVVLSGWPLRRLERPASVGMEFHKILLMWLGCTRSATSRAALRVCRAPNFIKGTGTFTTYRVQREGAECKPRTHELSISQRGTPKSQRHSHCPETDPGGTRGALGGPVRAAARLHINLVAAWASNNFAARKWKRIEGRILPSLSRRCKCR